MPDLDLGPDNYRKQDPRSGRWYVPDDPKVGMLVFFAALILLGVIYFNKDAVSAENLFWGVLIFAGAGGVGFYMWLKDIH